MGCTGSKKFSAANTIDEPTQKNPTKELNQEKPQSQSKTVNEHFLYNDASYPLGSHCTYL
jgi:hypothetical protein